MKIYISAPGKFDLFRWAEGFEKRGLLGKIFTDFYSKKNKIFSLLRRDVENISPDKVVSFPWPRFFRVISFLFFNYKGLEFEWFDRFVSKRITGADLVITRSSCALETIKRAKIEKIPTILYRGSPHIIFQNSILNDEREKLGLAHKEPPKELIERELQEYKITDYLFLPSSFAKRTYIDQGIDSSKILNFPLSVQNNDFLKLVKKRDKLKVIYVGNISLGKGIQYLLQVAKLLPENKVEFILIGGIDKEFSTLIKNIPTNVFLLGGMKKHEVESFYKEGDVFIFPSIFDGFGQVILEAMSFGLPVITTNHTGGPDVIEDGKEGFIVPIRSPELMAEKIEYLMNNPEICWQMGLAAQKKVENFTVDKFVDFWVDFLTKNKLFK